MEDKYQNYLKIYLILIVIFSTIWLYIKHQVGNDSTISEWIINYQGGFTRRGLPGEIAFQIATFFDVKLRSIILIMQIFFYSLYIYLIYQYFKNVKINAIILFTIFTPIFLIYHIAEVEVLARKEIFLFIGYIWFYTIANPKNDLSKSILWILFILPIVSILYEPTIFYYSFFAATIIIRMHNKKLTKIVSTIFVIFLPSLAISWFSAFSLITPEGFDMMVKSLSENFGEVCYMSCGLMATKREPLVHIMDTINVLTSKDYSIYAYLFRYSMIMIVGFFPLILLIINASLKNSILTFSKISIPFILLNIAVPIHWLMFVDWGRAVNITYVSSVLFFFFLYKNKFIDVNFKNIEFNVNKTLDFIINKTFIKSKKKLIIFIFIIFAFGWSPPTLLSADVNSFPGYRIPYKTIKFLFF